MEREKLKRIIGASVASAVLLFCILISVLVYQLVLVGRTRRQISDLQNERDALIQKNTETQDEIDRWCTDWKIEERARELGYLYKGDK